MSGLAAKLYVFPFEYKMPTPRVSEHQNQTMHERKVTLAY